MQVRPGLHIEGQEEVHWGKTEVLIGRRHLIHIGMRVVSLENIWGASTQCGRSKCFI